IFWNVTTPGNKIAVGGHGRPYENFDLGLHTEMFIVCHMLLYPPLPFKTLQNQRLLWLPA
ncbi:hypothetical protein, partial [Acinetobacter baumannii]|uniref:hypothetical protein n=1 Tax=Acinetobacter baumannii TaxID=470 RepID=UPI001C07DCCC